MHTTTPENVTSAMRAICDGIALVADPDTDGGYVAKAAMPREQARDLARRLEAAGVEASAAPDGYDPSLAWLYVRRW